jgi:hypothetical protein
MASMDLNFHPVVNVRTLLIWECISRKPISELSNSEEDIQNMKYAAYISGGARVQKITFNLFYGSNSFRDSFDMEFMYGFNYFKSEGKPIFNNMSTIDLILLLIDKYEIDYETIVSKMTFDEIKILLEKK